MLVSLWSLKGGVGVSVTAALLGLRAGRRAADGVVLVDVGGDLPLVLGVGGDGPGLTDWVGGGGARPPGALVADAVPVAPGVSLVTRGRSPWEATSDESLAAMVRALADHPATVIVDAGCLVGDGAQVRVARRFAAEATRSVLVARACYLGLARARASPVVPSGVVLLTEPHRALAATDVEAAVGAPVLARIDVDPAIARAVDAGLLGTRPLRSLDRALDAVA